MSNVLRGPADADHYRVKVGRYNDRWYADPLPTDGIATATDDSWPSVTSCKKASGSDWTFVGLKRVAAALEEKPDCLAGLPYDERYDRLKSINKIGLERAGGRGTQVHTYLERALRGEPITSPFDNPSGLPYLPAVTAFLDERQPELVAAELVCINRGMNGVGYGGTADGIMRIDGKVYKVDWKSRGEDSDHGAYPEEAGQIGAYAAADYFIADGPTGPRRLHLPALDGGLVVSIKPDGYRIYPVDLDKAKAHWERMHAWWVARRTEREAIGKPWAPVAPILDLAEQINAAATEAALNDLWAARKADFTPELVDLAKSRHEALAASAA